MSEAAEPNPPSNPLAPVPAGRPRRLVYLGTPQVAVQPLRALVESGFEIALVVTRPDKRRGRGSELSPSPVKAAALELGLCVAHEVEAVLDVDADLGVVVAFGRLIRRPVLEQLAMVNLHFSLLPRWRGAAPVERALLAGDEITGVCLMQLEEGLDTGPVFATGVVHVEPDVTLASLRDELVELGTTMLVEQLADGLGTPMPQHGEVTYAAKIDPAELHIDWAQPAIEIDRLVRLGGAWTTFRGKRLKIVAATLLVGTDRGAPERKPGTIDGAVVATGGGALSLVQVQPEGKPTMTVDAWRNGARPGADDWFGR